jgi:hypothetical protein
VGPTFLADEDALAAEVLSTSSPIRSLLSCCSQIGAVYRLNGFDEALVITNDEFIRRAHGVPLHAFVLAAPADLRNASRAAAIALDDEEVILLRVRGTSSLPDEVYLQHLRARAGIDQVVNDGRERPRPREEMIDPLTDVAMQTSGLTCDVLGTFYDVDRPGGIGLAFGSDIDNVYASSRLRVYKPWGPSLRLIASYMAEAQDDTRPRRPFTIGRVRYASTRRRESLAAEAQEPVDVEVDVDIADVVAHKTAVLGMTRKGKSNTNKVLATTTHVYAKEHDLRIGQLIFDPAGEYGNINEQDKTALAEIGPEHVIRYRLGATDDELSADPGLRPLALNFFDEDSIGVVWSVVGNFVRRENGAQYVLSFASAVVEGPADPQTRDDWRQVAHARRARMMAYACFLKAGLEPPMGWNVWVPMKEAVRQALIEIGGRRGEQLGWLDSVPTSRRGDNICLGAQHLLTVAEAIGANFHSDQRHPEIDDWVSVHDHRIEHLLDVLLERKGGGYRVLLPLRDGYHSASSSEDYAPAVHQDLVAGRIVIIDLSRGGEGVLQFASERVVNWILARASERFRAGLEPHNIQIFLEEAHRLFDREKFSKHLENDPYVRLAREAGKYKIGMIYSTQQVSSVEPDVLDNTANWIVAHLNSEAEVKLLRGRYDLDKFTDQILHAEDPGFVRLKTQSSRYVVPVQVRLFDAEMVSAARRATRKPLAAA